MFECWLVSACGGVGVADPRSRIDCCISPTSSSALVRDRVMSKQMLDKLDDYIGRRKFLRTLTGATAALLAGIFGVSRTAHAAHCVYNTVKCCCLCRTGACDLTQCSFVWSWSCPYTIECRYYSCRECFQTCTVGCDGLNCTNPDIICSKAVAGGLIPGCVPP